MRCDAKRMFPYLKSWFRKAIGASEMGTGVLLIRFVGLGQFGTQDCIAV